ncbi:Alanine--tRNA ligase [Ascidiaceihabitans donghaensis]|uniref:Alanine--tRNA ligase n=1 Tax=Ascidiaceihabitans donghaensis TaxID=1510460 RepID=A0A2R8BC06_9RHOB|nr:alanine--tRNA ligase [Ascidiaceihabitans donghaensis]SPH20599.1 Alanine--tRNA ligase [Ascidiaceihabitans donghaensis]
MSQEITTEAQLRAAWYEFWSARSHEVVKSASLIPTHPTAPMFVNSGMMQFVQYFLDEEPVPFETKRATSVQKCVRAGGKHNDLDAVGKSLRHLSFFEMMGNFSFGDYFKENAIKWAWEFVSDVLKIDTSKVWVTVHISDDEAEQIWLNDIGVPADRIQRLDKDNFWEMGETGPCGPSTELFYDFGPEFGPEGGPANPDAEHRFIEFWNVVFMESFRDSSGTLTPLPNQHVDTGAGLERLVGVLRGSPSLYSCDTLEALVNEAAKVSGKTVGAHPKDDQAMRVIADHVRSATFLISDGIIPSNEGRGYVLRRIIRRAVRFAYLLGIMDEMMPHMADLAIDTHKNYYPELDEQRDLIRKTLASEEAKFRSALETGLSILGAELKGLKGDAMLSGETAFVLHDTHGFPLEITAEIAEDAGHDVDVDTFRKLMTEQRERARASRKKGNVSDQAIDYKAIMDAYGATEFVGRDTYETTAKITGLVASDKGTEVVLDRSPFYAEGGGQIGDTGVLTLGSGQELAVLDTRPAMPGLHAHMVAAGTDADGLQIGDAVTAKIDAVRRGAIQRNHTSVHLIHWALRKVLGTHVKQQGSYVGADRLRFDFNHFNPLSEDELREIEDLINAQVLSNAPCQHLEMGRDEAIEKGALAFFGEKYGDTVRVMFAGPESIELCGGTHVSSLGQIGLITILSESSIGSNLRRIEAVTGAGVLNEYRRLKDDVAAATAIAGVPVGQLQDGLTRRMTELSDLQAEKKALSLRLENTMADGLVAQAVNGKLVLRVEGVEADGLKRLAETLQAKGDLDAVVIGTVTSAGRPSVVAVSKEGFDQTASDMLDPISAVMGGGHGKQPRVAVAGGKDASKIDAALDAAKAHLGL